MTFKYNRQDKIKELMNRSLRPSCLEIKDNSALHANHGNVEAGSTETHLFIKIRSDKFKGLNKIEMHRLAYKILKEEFANGLHAIELDLGS